MCALQVFEGKQRLWEKEVEELKRLYAAKLRQVSQHAQRAQRGLQLQLFKAQQEKNRLQEELNRLRRERGEESGASSNQVSPTLEETQWKVKVLRGQKKGENVNKDNGKTSPPLQVCQKSGEISLLKQQLRDSQAEVTQKLSELFQLKTQLRETRAELRDRDAQIDTLKLGLQGASARRSSSQTPQEEAKAAEESPSAGAAGQFSHHFISTYISASLLANTNTN